MPSNIERKARRKKQTRLIFEASGSSLAAGTLSPAKVRYSLRGENRKKQTAPVVIEESDDELSGIGRDEMAVIAPNVKGRKGPDSPIGTLSFCSSDFVSTTCFALLSFLSWK
jgi:hypothetical protein